MRRASVIVFLSLLPLIAVAQFVVAPHDARSAAMGGCHVDDGMFRYVAFDYRQGYAVAGMATRRVSVGWAIGNRGLTEASFSHFGDVAYHEQQLSAGYRLQVADWVEVGVEGRYLRIATDDGHYQPQQWLAASASARFKVGNRLHLSILTDSRPWDSSHPWRLHVGAAYRPVNRLLTLVELESEERLRLRFGAEYSYGRHFFFRAGFATHPFTLGGGIGVRYKIYVVDIGVETHNRLGITPQISLALWL